MTIPRPDLAVVELRDWLLDKACANVSNAAIEAHYRVWADAIGAILARCAEMEWRPIETAPRDGTRILVTDIDHPEILTVVSWVHGQWKCENPKGGISHWLPRPAAPQPKGPDDE